MTSTSQAGAAPGGAARRRRRRSPTAAAVRAIATAPSARRSQRGRDEVLVLETFEVDGTGFLGWCAGSPSRTRRGPRAIWRLRPVGRLVASTGVRAVGGFAPVAPGIVSQYWFSALSAGLMHPGTEAPSAGDTPTANASTSKIAVRRVRAISHSRLARS